MTCASRFAYMGGSVVVTPVLRAVWGQAIRRSHTARQDAGPFIGSLSSHPVGIHRVVKASSIDGPTRCQRSLVGSVVRTFCNNLLVPRIPPARMYAHIRGSIPIPAAPLDFASVRAALGWPPPRPPAPPHSHLLHPPTIPHTHQVNKYIPHTGCIMA